MFSALTVPPPAPLAPGITSVIPSYSGSVPMDHRVLQKASQGSNAQPCTEVHQHQHTHQHTHQSTFAPLFHPPSVILPTPIPPMLGTMAGNFNESPAKVDPFLRHSLFQPYGEVMPRLAPLCGPHTGPFSSLEGAFQPKPLSSNIPQSQWKKPGRWCAMHARIAWKVHHHKESTKKMQVEAKKIDSNEKPSRELSGKLKHLVQPFISSPESSSEQSSLSDFGSESVIPFGAPTNTAQNNRDLRNGQPPGIAVPSPRFTHSDPNKDPNTMDRSWVPECGRGWDSSTRKRELERENQIKVKKVKRVDGDRENVQEEDSNEGARPQRPRDTSFSSPVRQMPSFHAPSVHPIAIRSIRPGSHTLSGGYNLSRTHNTPPNELAPYQGAEKPYRAAPGAPLRAPVWDMYQGMDFPPHPDIVMRGEHLHSGIGSQQLSAGWAQRNSETYQGFTQTSIHSSLALMQQERTFLKERENLHMLRENDYHRYSPLQPLHSAAVNSHLPSPSLLTSPYSASQMCQMGLPQTYQGGHIHPLHPPVPLGTHYPLASFSGTPHRTTSVVVDVGKSHSIMLIDPNKQWTQ
ncbi:autism susceptibility gene 2 protein homolog isoform X2 [Osmerus eperlanus]